MDNPFKNMPKPALYASLAGGAAIGGYMVYRHHKSTGSWNPWHAGSAASTNSAGNPTTIDPVTGLAYSQDNAIDPLTGEAYLAEAEQYGSVAAAEASVSAYGQTAATGSGIPVNPASPPPSGSINTPVGTNVYTSNAAWAQAVQAGLADVGYNPTDVAQALGLYLTGEPMTSAEAQLINTAIAEFGPAPAGNLQVILAPDRGPRPRPPIPTPTVPQAIVPDVIGQALVDAQRSIGDEGLKSTVSGPRTTKAGEVRMVTAQSPGAGSKVDKGSTVHVTYKIANPPRR